MNNFYEIKIYNDPILRTKTNLITDFAPGYGNRLLLLIEDMKHIMKENHGIGLAAPQIGLSLKLAIIFDNAQFYTLINPEIIYEEGNTVFEEGCLSIPSIYETIKRSSKIIISNYTVYGEKTTLEADGFLARIILHEMDHLEGKLFIDYLSSVKKRIIRNKIKRYKARMKK